MFTWHLVLPPKHITFNLQHSVFNHLFTTFLNLTIVSSLFIHSNSLSKNTFNLFKDEGSWPSHCKTLMSKILGIKVLTTSSHAFFPTHHLSTSPPAFLLILWGFLPATYLTSLATSLSFFTILLVALITLFDLTNGTIACCIEVPKLELEAHMATTLEGHLLSPYIVQ